MGKRKKTSKEVVAAAKVQKAVQRVRETQSARVGAVLRKLQPIAREINARFERAAHMEGKADDHRLSAALKLDEAKKICARGKVNFREWVEENVSQGWEEAKKLARVGGSENPKLALEDMRAGTKARTRKARERASRSAPVRSSTSPPVDAFTTVDEMMKALDRTTRLALVKDQVQDLGMVVLSEARAEELWGAEKRIKEARDGVGRPLPKTMRKLFPGLSASEKMEFLKWAAESIGARVEHDFAVSATETASPEKEVDLDKSMPDILRRKKTAAKKGGKR
ncbi:hypothetical protein LCGC14_1892290 [marine sediment metagenome]|uniref:Uncharacterized protein n=1 Tax=marine sediment metagenome TaxID=412755 RepID=A0A0F9IX50_9ZZZZ